MNFFRSYYPNFLSDTTSIGADSSIPPIPLSRRENMLNVLRGSISWGIFEVRKHERILLASMVRTIQKLGDESTCKGSIGFVSDVHLPYEKHEEFIWLH